MKNQTEALPAFVAFAEKAHEGQTRADGTPYIEHPKAVADIAAYLGENEYGLDGGDLSYLRILGVSHDIIEDKPEATYALAELIKASFHELGFLMIADLADLTHRQGVSYLSYILNIKGRTCFARIVKQADIIHNYNSLDSMPSKAAKKGLATKYELAYYILTGEKRIPTLREVQ